MAGIYSTDFFRIKDHQELEPCAVDFTAAVNIEDIYRIWVAAATVASGDPIAGFLPHMAPASPDLPAISSLTPRHTKVKLALSPTEANEFNAKSTEFGSNAWAIGRDATRSNETSVHLYNPHFPWAGIHRLYMIHVTIPGELDAMGVALGGFPVPLSGFTNHIAWGLTFSPAARWSMADLLLEQDLLSYKVDDVNKYISSEILSIPVLGEDNPRLIPFYRAEEGPILEADPFFLSWGDDPNNPGHAYAVHDVNANNTRMVEQFLRIAQSEDVYELQAQLSALQGVPWSYVVASDAKGEVFFSDISAIPDISTTDIFNCVVSAVGAFHLQHGMVVLDGTRSECLWDGLMDPVNLPQTIRSDYVANSNNTYEIPNLDERLKGFSPVLGGEGKALDLRANLGLNMIHDRLTGNDGMGNSGFTARNALKVFQQTRNRGAELLIGGIVEDCQLNSTGEFNGNTFDLTEVCAALADWDQQNTVRSQGATVFRGLWMALSDGCNPPSALAEIKK